MGIQEEIAYAAAMKTKLDSEIKHCVSSAGIQDNFSESLGKQVIISLTSYPERMEELHYCLHTLLSQTVKPNAVILWLAREQFPDGLQSIPRNVLALQNRGLRIEWTEDIKSYKKLIPAVVAYPSAIIATADDDVFYESTWLEEMLNNYNENEILCYRAHKVVFDNNSISLYEKWIKCVQSPVASTLFCPTGVSGILWPPDSLPLEALDRNAFMQSAPKQDDIWLWANAIVNGKTIKVIPAKPNVGAFISTKLPYINPEREHGLNDQTTLFKENGIIGGGNDRAIINMFKNFPALKTIIKEKYQPCVSVIIPVKDSEHTLRKCLDSVLGQTLHDIEIICVENGSADESLSVLDSYSKRDSRVIVKSIKEANAAIARNFALDIANGEYIGFVDADDWVDDNYFETLYTTAMQQNADLVRTTHNRYCEQSRNESAGRKNLVIETCYKHQKLLGIDDHWDVIWDAIYRFEYIKENNICFDEKQISVQDVLFTTKAIVFANKCIPAVGTMYHYSDKNAGTQLSTLCPEKAQYIQQANHKRIEFINTIDNFLLDNYLSVFERSLNASEDLFKGIIKECGWNDSQALHDYFNNMVSDFKLCKYPVEYRIKYYRDSFALFDTEDFDAYLSSISEPSVSIIVPLHNDEMTITRSIECCSKQTYQNIEVVIVDDASTDSSSSIVQQYMKQDRRIRLITLSKNSGTLQARRIGVIEARGKYLMFLDADDELDLEAVEKCYRKAEESGADIVGFKMKVLDVDGNRKGSFENLLQPPVQQSEGLSVLSELFPVGIMPQGHLPKNCYLSKLIKSAYSYIPSDLILRRVEDLPITFVAAILATKYVSLQDALYVYHFGSGISGRSKFGINLFKVYLSGIEGVETLKLYFDTHELIDEEIEIIFECYRSARLGIIANVIKYLLTGLKEEYHLEGLALLLQKIDVSDITMAIEVFEPTLKIPMLKLFENLDETKAFSQGTENDCSK